MKDFQYKTELTKGNVGLVEPCRHVLFERVNKLKAEIKIMEAAGIVSKVEKPSDFVNPLVIVRKTDGSIRVIKKHIQLPSMEEITAKVKKAEYFIKLDAN